MIAKIKRIKTKVPVQPGVRYAGKIIHLIGSRYEKNYGMLYEVEIIEISSNHIDVLIGSRDYCASIMARRFLDYHKCNLHILEDIPPFKDISAFGFFSLIFRDLVERHNAWINEWYRGR